MEADAQDGAAIVGAWVRVVAVGVLGARGRAARVGRVEAGELADPLGIAALERAWVSVGVTGGSGLEELGGALPGLWLAGVDDTW